MPPGRKKSLSDQVESRSFKTTSATATKVLASKSLPKKKSYLLDLRIHTPVSLGYTAIEGIDTAPALVRLAKVKGLDMIAVTDYYSGAFIDRVVAAAIEYPLLVIPGVAMRCSLGACDDLVILSLFPEGYNGTMISEFLKKLSVPESAAGDKSYIIKADLKEIVAITEKAGGIVVPSQVDKTPARISILPRLVEEYGFRMFDVTYSDTSNLFRLKWPRIKFNLFCFSSATALAQVGTRMARVKMSTPDFIGLRTMAARQSPLIKSKIV